MPHPGMWSLRKNKACRSQVLTERKNKVKVEKLTGGFC